MMTATSKMLTDTAVPLHNTQRKRALGRVKVLTAQARNTLTTWRQNESTNFYTAPTVGIKPRTLEKSIQENRPGCQTTPRQQKSAKFSASGRNVKLFGQSDRLPGQSCH